MTGLLAATMVAVGLYCLLRVAVPALRAPDHRRDLDAWHLVMAGAMVVMLMSTSPRPYAVVALAVFGAGLVWALTHLAARPTRSAYLRLGIGCAAMAAMLLPAATAVAQPSASTAVAGAVDHAQHTHAAHAVATTAAQGAGIAPPTLLVAGLLVALGAVLSLRVVGALGPGGGARARVDACCDVAMAAAMAYMLALAL